MAPGVVLVSGKLLTLLEELLHAVEVSLLFLDLLALLLVLFLLFLDLGGSSAASAGRPARLDPASLDRLDLVEGQFPAVAVLELDLHQLAESGGSTGHEVWRAASSAETINVEGADRTEHRAWQEVALLVGLDIVGALDVGPDDLRILGSDDRLRLADTAVVTSPPSIRPT
jgi:hypothetical protein